MVGLLGSEIVNRSPTLSVSVLPESDSFNSAGAKVVEQALRNSAAPAAMPEKSIDEIKYLNESFKPLV